MGTEIPDRKATVRIRPRTVMLVSVGVAVVLTVALVVFLVATGGDGMVRT